MVSDKDNDSDVHEAWFSGKDNDNDVHETWFSGKDIDSDLHEAWLSDNDTGEPNGGSAPPPLLEANESVDLWCMSMRPILQ